MARDTNSHRCIYCSGKQGAMATMISIIFAILATLGITGSVLSFVLQNYNLLFMLIPLGVWFLLVAPVVVWKKEREKVLEYERIEEQRRKMEINKDVLFAFEEATRNPNYLKDINEEVDCAYGGEVTFIREEDISKLKAGKALWFGDGEYSHFFILESKLEGWVNDNKGTTKV